MTDWTTCRVNPEIQAELRRLQDAGTPVPWAQGDPAFGGCNAQCVVSISSEAMGRDVMGPMLRPALFDVELIVAAVNALPALLDAAELLADVRDQVTRGALCPMCSTGMIRRTVGLVCPVCGTDYARPKYASMRVNALPALLDAADERAALAATMARVRALATEWATQPTDYDEDTEQQIEDGNAILRALDGPDA